MGDCQANWGRLALETTNSGESIVPVYSSGDISLKKVEVMDIRIRFTYGSVPSQCWFRPLWRSKREHLGTIM